VPDAQVTIEISGAAGKDDDRRGDERQRPDRFTPDTVLRIDSGPLLSSSTSSPGLVIPVESVAEGWRSAHRDAQVGDRRVQDQSAVLFLPPCRWSLRSLNRDFKRSWNAGASVSAEGAIEVGLAGKVAAGLSFTIAEKSQRRTPEPDLVRTAGVEGGLRRR